MRKDGSKAVVSDISLIKFVDMMCSRAQINKISGGLEIKNKEHIKILKDGAVEYTKQILNFFRTWTDLNDGNADMDCVNGSFLTGVIKETNYFYYKYKSYLAPIEKMSAVAYQTSLAMEKEAKAREDYINAWATKTLWINIIPAIVYCFYMDIDYDNTIKTSEKAIMAYFSSMAVMRGDYVEPMEDYLCRML